MIAIVDYGMGNLRSVQKAFEKNGVKPVITSSPRVIQDADKIVLPGVGAFSAAMNELEKLRLVDILINRLEAGVPYLGLCLGMQLLLTESEESGNSRNARGFGIVSGCVKRFGGSLKVPHMGWNTVKESKKNCPLLKGLREKDYFYFVHSYYAEPRDQSWVCATTDYGKNFCSIIWKDNIFATQFHPEKSQSVGLKVIKNFVALKS